MSKLFLRFWGSYSKAYLFEVGSGRLERRRDARRKADGFVKRCLIGKKILVFKDERAWFIQVGKRRTILSDPELVIRFLRFGPCVTLIVDLQGQSSRHLYTQIMQDFVRFVDPGYDRLDQECEDFLVWLEIKVDSERRSAAQSRSRTESEAWSSGAWKEL
ncbi:MAG: hypothetical protein GY722_22355 [bacterium]|nr:hypothetical protein [bacterium]